MDIGDTCPSGAITAPVPDIRCKLVQPDGGLSVTGPLCKFLLIVERFCGKIGVEAWPSG